MLEIFIYINKSREYYFILTHFNDSNEMTLIKIQTESVLNTFITIAWMMMNVHSTNCMSYLFYKSGKCFFVKRFAVRNAKIRPYEVRRLNTQR